MCSWITKTTKKKHSKEQDLSLHGAIFSFHPVNQNSEVLCSTYYLVATNMWFLNKSHQKELSMVNISVESATDDNRQVPNFAPMYISRTCQNLKVFTCFKKKKDPFVGSLPLMTCNNLCIWNRPVPCFAANFVEVPKHFWSKRSIWTDNAKLGPEPWMS